MHPKRDFYAPDGYTKMAGYRVYREYFEEFPILLRLFRGWDHHDVYEAAVEWIKSNGQAKFCESMGVSYIDGYRYFDTVQFKTVEDRLVFTLKFSEICDTTFYARGFPIQHV